MGDGPAAAQDETAPCLAGAGAGAGAGIGAEAAAATAAEDWKAGGFGLYIHWPFCQAKCPYCDFNSHVAATIDEPRWERAFLAEIDRCAELTAGRVLGSVFFGGGTPSLMAPRTVHALLERVRRRWTVANDLEVTLEANPTSVEAGRFAGYADAGVNRVSLGVQALDDGDLRRLGRLHTAAEARAAFEIARAQFGRVSFDLIYARQNQTPAAWRAELNAALALAVDHLSLYQLTVEPGTAFAARHAAGKLAGLPDEDRAVALWEITQEACAAAGLPGYEISNHAREGAQSRHNLVYWRYGDYAGIGPGAHGRLTLGRQRHATETHRMPARWLEAVETAGHGELGRVPIAARDQAEEYALLAMRLAEGLDRARLETLRGAPIPGEALDALRQDGLIGIAGPRIVATGRGRLLLDHLIARLAA